MLRGIDMARAKQDGEDRHCHRDVQRDVTQHRLHRAARGSDMHEDCGQRRRHRFELKRDVGNGADDGDERYGGGDGLGLAVTGGNEVSNRRDVLCLGQPHDAHDQRRAQPDQQDGPDIDGQKVEAGARCESHRAKERPGGAVDRERERIDEVAPTAFAPEPPSPVPVARNHEQEADIAECEGDNDPALQHDGSAVLGHEARRRILPHEWGGENIAGSLVALPAGVSRAVFACASADEPPFDAAHRRRH